MEGCILDVEKVVSCPFESIFFFRANNSVRVIVMAELGLKDINELEKSHVWIMAPDLSQEIEHDWYSFWWSHRDTQRSASPSFTRRKRWLY